MKCLYCSKTTIKPNGWCNTECHERWSALRRKPSVKEVLFTCTGCKRDILLSSRRVSGRKFCSRACKYEHYEPARRYGPANGNWRGGRALYYGPGWKALKKQVRSRDVVCRRCGKTAAENGMELDVHHVDPFRFSGDHSLDNLLALCRSCHMRADDHGRRGSARFLRQQGIEKQPTKRELRRRRARRRTIERMRSRAMLQAQAFELHAAGKSLREIARNLSVSHQTAANWLSGSVRRQVS